jgi:hypothetical protein
LDRRLGGPQSQSGCSCEKKNSQPLPGFEPLISQPAAQCYTTELSWFPTEHVDSFKYLECNTATYNMTTGLEENIPKY